ncbi:M48 family metallopeptidase [Streptomyces sp. NPDC127105]|uniref:M48 family metallopeptidase n=1 Tax=Streptomyces sp. NPDC127105 TaxID=3345359 RepID=UPI003656343D
MDGRISGGRQVSAVRAWSFTAAMAAVARLPLIGFLLLIAAGGLVWGGWQMIALPMLWLLPALYTRAVLPDALPGRAVRPDDEPELAALVRDMAERTGFGAPLLVRIVPEPAVLTYRVRIGGGHAYALLLGLPLVRALSATHLAAVIAHELAHERHFDDRRTRALLAARVALAERLEGRLRPLAPLAAPLLRATQPWPWQEELAADAEAARVVGGDAAREAVERVAVIDAAFDGIAQDWVEDLVEEGSYPVDLYEAFDLALQDPLVRARAAREDAEEEALDVYATATHPPTAVRTAALPHTGTGTGTGTSTSTSTSTSAAYGSAPLVLRDAEVVVEWCVQRLACADGPGGTLQAGGGGGALRPEDLKPVRLLQLDADRFRLPADGGHRAEALAAATGQSSPTGALRAALDAVADGDWYGLARRMRPRLRWLPAAVRRSLGCQVLASAMGAALVPLLLEAGWSCTSRWMSTVLTAPDGMVVDLYEVLVTAVDGGDPAPVHALLDKSGTEKAERA